MHRNSLSPLSKQFMAEFAVNQKNADAAAAKKTASQRPPDPAAQFMMTP